LRRRLDVRAEDHQETVIPHKDGRRVTVKTGIKTSYTNERPQLIAIVRDITERKRVEEWLAHAEERKDVAKRLGMGLAPLHAGYFTLYE
jgi:PAS domain-containing protein